MGQARRDVTGHHSLHQGRAVVPALAACRLCRSVGDGTRMIISGQAGMIVVRTSFPDAWRETVGKRFVESFLKYWPEDVQLEIYRGGTNLGFAVPGRVTEHDLLCDTEFRQFIHETRRVKDDRDYRWKAIPFSRKVCSITGDRPLAAETMMWLDAD